MSLPSFEQLDSANNTFSDWLNKTNEMIELFRLDVVTANNSLAETTGNSSLLGDFSANGFFVVDELRGGDHTTSNTLFVTSDANFDFDVNIDGITTLQGDVTAYSNVTITNITGQVRVEGANIDITSATDQLSIFQTDNNGSIIIDADFGANGALETEFLFRTDNTDALQIIERDIKFFDSIGSNSNFYWDSTNEYLGIHTAAPTVEVDITGNTHTTDLVVHNQTNIGTLANTDSLIVRSNVVSNLIPANTATFDIGSDTLRWNDIYAESLTISTAVDTNQLNVRTNITSDLIPSTANTYSLGNTSNTWAGLSIESVQAKDLSVTNVIDGTANNALHPEVTYSIANTDSFVPFAAANNGFQELNTNDGLKYNASIERLIVSGLEIKDEFIMPETLIVSTSNFQDITVLESTTIKAVSANTPVTHVAVFDTDPTVSEQTIKTRTSEELRLDIGAIGGGGAADKIAFWDGSNTINNNAQLHWDNTNSRLGINNNTPQEKLDIQGKAISNAMISRTSTHASDLTTTLNFNDATNFVVDLTQNTTLDFANVNVGQSGMIVFKQDSVGGHLFTLPGKAKTPIGGMTIDQWTSANSVSILNYFVLDTNNVLVNYIGNFA